MNNPHGIVLLGANGSGKSTLGRELARVIGIKTAAHGKLQAAILRRAKQRLTVLNANSARKRVQKNSIFLL